MNYSIFPNSSLGNPVINQSLNQNSIRTRQFYIILTVYNVIIFWCNFNKLTFYFYK